MTNFTDETGGQYGVTDVLSAVVAKYPDLAGTLMQGSWSADEGISFLLGLISQLGPTAAIALTFVFGVILGLAVLVFVRLAYFYPHENPYKPGAFPELFNEQFGNADFFRRVLHAVEDKP